MAVEEQVARLLRPQIPATIFGSGDHVAPVWRVARAHVVLGARAALVARSKVLRARVERENLVLTRLEQQPPPVGVERERVDWDAIKLLLLNGRQRLELDSALRTDEFPLAHDALRVGREDEIGLARPRDAVDARLVLRLDGEQLLLGSVPEPERAIVAAREHEEWRTAAEGAARSEWPHRLHARAVDE